MAVATITPTDPIADETTAPVVADAETVEPSSPGLENPGGGGLGADYDRIVWVAPSSLRIGPNVREEDAEPDPGQVREFKKHGVQDAIKAYRDDTGELVVLVGQLRTLGAIKGGVEQVPVWVVPAPSGDEKAQLVERITLQFGENRHRKAMTRRDEFRAYEQLQLAGMSPTSIGRTLSVGRKEVVASLAVGRSELAAAAADTYDLTLDQAAVVAEFEGYGDLDTAQRLISTAVEQPHNFDTLAQRKRNDRAEAERRRELVAACTEQLTTAGVVILGEEVPTWTGVARALDRLRPSPQDAPGTELTVEVHADCPGHAAWIEFDYDEDDNEIPVPLYGCADFAVHGHALRYTATTQPGDGQTSGPGEPGSDQADAQAAEIAAAELAAQKATIERRWVRNNNKDADAALPKRHRWLAGIANRARLPKQAQQWLALRAFEASALMHKAMEQGHPLAHKLAKIEPPARAWSGWTGQDSDTLGELHRRIATASDAKAAVYHLYLILCAMEEAYTRDSWRNPTSLDKVYIAMAIDLGYDAPDIDRKVLHPDNLAAIIASELGLDAPDQSPDTHTDTQDDTDGDGTPAEFVDDGDIDGDGQDATEIIVDNSMAA